MESDRKINSSLPPSGHPPPTSGSVNSFHRARTIHGRTTGPTRRSTKGQWSPEEDDILCKAVERFKGKNWKKIAECFKDRTDVQCLHRWQKVLNPELVKGPWSKEEDEIITQLVNKYGPKKWSTIAQHLPGRIGKQCRERWHNHLNPGINKEAWTQEEELVLIRAHQMHGNRWAELTKYLPGRTDNAIKNHWNSSVKKKLDSYITSGLLAQFQSLPLVSQQNLLVHGSPSLARQSSCDDSVCREGAEAEENSECSQVGCSQTPSEMSNAAYQSREDFFLAEESDPAKLSNFSPTTSCSEHNFAPLDEITYTIPETPCELSCSSDYLENNFPRDPGTLSSTLYNLSTLSLPNLPSFELVTEACGLSVNLFGSEPRNDVAQEPPQQTRGYSYSAMANSMGIDAIVPGLNQKTEEAHSQVRLAQEAADGSTNTKCPNIIDMDRYRDSLRYQYGYRVTEAGSVILEPYSSIRGTAEEAPSCQQPSSAPSEKSGGDKLMLVTDEPNHTIQSLALSQGETAAVNAQEGSNPTNVDTSFPCQDHLDVEFTEQTETLDSAKLVPVNTFSLETSSSQHTCPTVEKVEATGEKKAGTLCYEPPRIPSLDIPFFSCDLAQSGSDAQQDFSPLGIRQLMMSSMNSLTPFKLWDSPSSDDSPGPDAVLKSAAKTFACTPSILKKRHRDLLSPLSPFSERRFDKKTGGDANQGFLCTSRLTKEFSKLDVVFSEIDHGEDPSSFCHNQTNAEALVEDKENLCPTPLERIDEAKHGEDSRDTNLEITKKINSIDVKGGNCALESASDDHASETPRGILAECHINDEQFTSPDAVRPTSKLNSSEELTEVLQFMDAMTDCTSDRAGSIMNPSSVSQKKQNNDRPKLCSVGPSVMVDSLVNEIGAENLNIFGGTPFRRSIESPSAWKSPWYFSSLVPCPRFDSDLTIEDIGIFMSPGERSLDALGLMKQINEQSAEAYADAREILGGETPESILRQRCLESQKNEEISSEGRLHLASNILTERRTLDFSECGTPAKSTDRGNCISAASFSSPSSCLLKNYR